MAQTSATACDVCLAGHYCEAGASVALPCAAGSYSNATNLTSAGECTTCDAGAACPAPAVACPTWPDVVAAVGRAHDAGWAPL